MDTERQNLNPYVGPRPFRVSDSKIFFGRLREIRQIVNLIYVNPILLLYSKSGVGRTSLLSAGVIPRLIEDGFDVFPLGRVGGMFAPNTKPEEIQNIFIFNYLLSSLEEKAHPATLTRKTLSKYLNELQHSLDNMGQPVPRVLIFDQFEELFISHEDRWKDRQNFFEQIRQVLDSDHLLRIVFAFREEYIGEMERYAHLLPDGISARFHLEPLRMADALRAVLAPLSMTERHFAEGVAEKIISDLMMIRVPTVEGDTRWIQGEFVEPLELQVVMRNLWKHLPPNVKVITENHTLDLHISDAALSDFYDSCIHNVVSKSPEISEEMLRNWFEEALITPLGTRAVVFRGQKETAGMPNHVVNEIENQRLIRDESQRGVLFYELTHDRFIRPIQESNRKFSQGSKL